MEPLTVSVAQMAEQPTFCMTNLTPSIDIENRMIRTPDVNRPALQLTGYYNDFECDRVQIIGNVEHGYLRGLPEEERKATFARLLGTGIPCIVFTKMAMPDDSMIALSEQYGVPCFVTERTTSQFMAELIRWLAVELAPSTRLHGVLVDVFGEGVLIMGESGIGKSEAALLDLRNQVPVHLVCHGAARHGLGEQHGFLRRQNFAGFRHKAHAAHQNGLVVRLGRVDAELVAVAGEVGDFANFARLVAVGEDTNILLLL